MSLMCVIYVCSVWEVWFGAWSHIRRKRLNNTTFSIKIIQQNCFCNAVSVNREPVKLHLCVAESFGDQRKQSASYWKLTKRNSAKLALAKRPSVKLHSVKRYFSENVAVSVKWHSTGQRRCMNLNYMMYNAQNEFLGVIIYSVWAISNSLLKVMCCRSSLSVTQLLI